MCGIAGIWNFTEHAVTAESIIRFTDSLAHRGPDGRGIWLNEKGNLAFGHRRLAIIDLSNAADQPMHYADNRYHIVFNGEIYNFLEIRKELELKGYNFKTESDTEVILAAFHEWKEGMQLKFNGMWALVIYDSANEICFVSRDRFGIKPFLYTLNSKQFAFASELKAFLQLDGFQSAIDKDSSVQFLSTGFGVEGSTKTMLHNVSKLQAGHCGWVKDGRITIKRWWSTLEHAVDIPLSMEDQAEKFRELFFDSIKLRMRSDVSVGSSLSGGFDSSAVVSALAAIGKEAHGQRMAADWQQTFIATFPGKSNDERPQAEEVVNYTGVKGHFFEINETESLEKLDQVLFDFDDVYVGIPVAPWLIYRELRKSKVVVSLDGHGADELMGAYMQPAGAYLANAPGLLENWKQNAALLRQSSLLSKNKSGFKNNLNTLLQFHPDFEKARAVFQETKNIKDKYFRKPSSSFLRQVNTNQEMYRFDAEEEYGYLQLDETNRNLYRMFHHDILPTILRNFDRVSMAHGIEIRMPFMDWRLVSYVFSLPGSSKIKEGYTKRVAREAMKNRMPESIRDSKVKIGFNAPMPEWFNGPLKEWIRNVVDKQTAHEWIDISGLKKEIEHIHKNGNWNWSNTGNMWKFIHFLWFEQNFLTNK